VRAVAGGRGTLLQWMRFQLVGAANAGVDWGVFGLLTLVAPPRSVLTLVVYNSVAVAASLVMSYYGNSRWTFRGAVGAKAPWSRFVAQGLVNVAINNGAVAGLGMIWLARGATAAVWAIASKALAAALASLVSFTLMRRWVFRPSRQPASEGQA
jgi:putative flippase GtrA